jgi:DNA ligase-1
MVLDHDGDTTTCSGSGSKPYVLRNIGDVLDCSCPAWRNQSFPIDVRTCKHLIKVRGVEVERARVGNDHMPTKFKNAGVTAANPAGVFINPNMGPKAMAAVKAHLANPPKTTPDNPLGLTPAQQVAAIQHRNTIQEATNPLGVLLAKKFMWDWDPTGWWKSEKLDGVRAYWDGKDFRSRENNIYHAPDWYKAQMPKEALDGELWIGRHRFQETVSIVRRLNGGDAWKQIKYRIYDSPEHDGRFEDRIRHAKSLKLPAFADVLEQTLCEGMEDLERTLHEIIKLGGEGVMLRKPGSRYIHGRSPTLYKVKRFTDDEAVVETHTPGKGKYKGLLGALWVTWNNKKFKVGTGLSDADRRNPPAIGARITFRYTETTKAGIPKCASFVCVRDYE